MSVNLSWMNCVICQKGVTVGDGGHVRYSLYVATDPERKAVGVFICNHCFFTEPPVPDYLWLNTYKLRYDGVRWTEGFRGDIVFVRDKDESSSDEEDEQELEIDR